ncbi:MAG: hypothetical protein ABJZ55_09745 [Fuerstiella sp.]
MKFAATFLVFVCLLLNGTLFLPDSIDTKSTKSTAVAYFNAWTVGWNADRLKHGMQGYWDSPIFYPVDRTFAFSEPQPATLLVAPLVWLSDSPLVAYKAWLVICLVANGMGGVLICRRLGHRQATQWVAGFSMILLPMSQQRIDVIQLVPVWGMLWFFSTLFLLNRRCSAGRAIECGVSFAACFALCLHHSLFLSLVMSIACVVFLPKLKNGSFVISSVIAIVVAGVLICPMVLPVLKASQEHGFVRSVKIVERLSAYPSHYIASQDNSWLDPLNWFDGLKPDAKKSRRFHLGWIRMLFAVVAVVFCFRQKQNRRWTMFLILTAAAGFVFSLGLHLNLAGWKPWETVQQYVPGFQQVRNVFRFAWFVQIALMLLALSGFDALVNAWDRRRAKTGSGVFAKAMMIMLGCLLAVEVWPEPATAHYVPAAHKHRQWVNFVQQECRAGQPIVCLPMSTGNRLKEMEIETRWMLLGLGHSAPMLNGYSGFFPKPYNHIVSVVNTAQASDQLFAELLFRKVTLIVVARGFPISHQMKTFQSENFELTEVFADDVGIDVYRLRSKQ